MGRIESPPPDYHKPRLFTTKKWTIAATILFNIGLLVMLFCNSHVYAEHSARQSAPSEEDPNYTEIRTLHSILFKVAAILSIIVESIFLGGVIRHEICLTTAYLILSILLTCFSAFSAFSSRSKLLFTYSMWSALICCLCIQYIQELRRMNTAQLRLKEGILTRSRLPAAVISSCSAV